MKVLADNLERLSKLAGFNPPTTNWFDKPAETLRFMDVLEKIYLSEFTTGEILFLFTVSPHLDGDDPFPEQDANEALDRPLNLPEDNQFGLWHLRRKLLQVTVTDEECDLWTWHRIEHVLRDDFGCPQATLETMGKHFFPDVLARHGIAVSVADQQYRAPLPAALTTPSAWNSPPGGPFRYDTAGGGELVTRLPLRDDDINHKLSHLPQLNPNEIRAVQTLCFSPRAELAPFAMIFANFGDAEHHLIEAAEEDRRWRLFQQAFALFYARCRVIAEHLAGHVAAATDTKCVHPDLAWAILRRLLADENHAIPPTWEGDDGHRPPAFAFPLLGSGAFAALLGLTGTGLLSEYSGNSGGLKWREIRASTSAFGPSRNEWNTPVPTILPTIASSAFRYAIVRNGFAIRREDGHALGGAEGVSATWKGILLVDEPGDYKFYAGLPSEEGCEPKTISGNKPHWRVRLGRTQKTWTLLNHGWAGEEAPVSESLSVHLKRSAYSITIEFRVADPGFNMAENACPHHAGFAVKYRGPDSGDEVRTIPVEHLYQSFTNQPLSVGLELTGTVLDSLRLRYSSSLRDIRRTYQRAFKALLFSQRLGLAAHRIPHHRQSEIDYLLDNPERFAGVSYYLPTAGPPYISHRAWLFFDFLPVNDLYHPPSRAADDRVDPSLKRRQALFDWWERLFDFSVMRDHVRHSRGRLAWLLFVEAADKQPADPADLLSELGIDLEDSHVLLSYCNPNLAPARPRHLSSIRQ